MFTDYLEAGSWSESTLRANRVALDRLQLRQRVAVDVSHRSTITSILGEPAALPLAMSPLGLLGMQHADGEIHAALACQRFGVPFTLSTMSICSIEDVAASGAPFWFQLYLMRDRGLVARLIDRAAAAGCRVLVLTLDLQVLGVRHRDVANGLSAPPRPTLRNLLDLLRRPAWCLGMLGARRRDFGNLAGEVPQGTDTRSLASWIETQFDPSMTWDDVAWVRQRWPGKLVLKGILDADDARLALRCGADALVVSNHGGRQLDGAPASIDALPAVLDAVGSSAEVHLDSGIRSGQDIFRALAHGARAVHAGRALGYGLGAGGGAGVCRALQILHTELDRTMALTGRTRVGDIDASALFHPLAATAAPAARPDPPRP